MVVLSVQVKFCPFGFFRECVYIITDFVHYVGNITDMNHSIPTIITAVENCLFVQRCEVCRGMPLRLAKSFNSIQHK